MQQVLQAVREPLYEAFIYYSSIKKPKTGNSDSNDNKSQQTRIHFDGFAQMLDELQLLSSAFTKPTFKSIFQRAQFQDDSFEEQTIQSYTSEQEIDFESFIEVLVVIAIYKKPDPYLPVSTRVEEFLLHSIIHPLNAKHRIASQPKKSFAINQT